MYNLPYYSLLMVRPIGLDRKNRKRKDEDEIILEEKTRNYKCKKNPMFIWSRRFLIVGRPNTDSNCKLVFREFTVTHTDRPQMSCRLLAVLS